MSSPRERRCSAFAGGDDVGRHVLSARAEVFRCWRSPPRPRTSPLRASGGVPRVVRSKSGRTASSPRERRCSGRLQAGLQRPGVLSARAEVFRTRQVRRWPGADPLRASGGVPLLFAGFLTGLRSSPRERRCSVPAQGPGDVPAVLSARAEVFRRPGSAGVRPPRPLRASGGVPPAPRSSASRRSSSPRERRCSAGRWDRRIRVAALSARAEVFRGRWRERDAHDRPLRERRCSDCRTLLSRIEQVLSARAEVFLHRHTPRDLRRSPLRASGGVPASRTGRAGYSTSSLRERRCSVGDDADHRGADVLSARAEVASTTPATPRVGSHHIRVISGVLTLRSSEAPEPKLSLPTQAEKVQPRPVIRTSTGPAQCPARSQPFPCRPEGLHMVYHQQTKNLLVSYSPKKLGFF